MFIKLKNRDKIKNDPRKGYKETVDLFYKNISVSSSKRNKWQEVWGRSTHLQFKNQTMKWCSSDDKKNFEINKRVPEMREILEINGWLDKNLDLTYEFNEHGFRSERRGSCSEKIFVVCQKTAPIPNTQ